MRCFVVISGCSGGGKSTLLAELGRRGYPIVEEPGRRIVRQEQATGGTALPWADPQAFLRRALEMAIADWKAAQAHEGWVFFDRGVIDAASGLAALTGAAMLQDVLKVCRYHSQVFLAPPWPELFATDAERRHGFEVAREEYRRLETVFPALGYDVTHLPKTSVDERADFVLTCLTQVPRPGKVRPNSPDRLL